MERLFSDVRFGVRQLRKTPGFTVIAIVVLAIGIGANITIFGLANSVLFKPLDVMQPDRVIRVYSGIGANVRYNDYLQYRDRNQTLASLAIFANTALNFRIDGDSEQFNAFAVSGNYFDTLGIRPALGRMIQVADDVPGAPGSLVIGHDLWRNRFASDSNIVGRAVNINGSPFTIVGVAPAGFVGVMMPISFELWVPWNSTAMANPEGRSGHPIGRLKSDVSVEQAQADLIAVATQLMQENPERGRVAVTVYPARRLVQFAEGPVTAFAGLLMGVVGLVLLIACMNIANLMLARSVERQRETGIRLALGASRGRVMRQSLTESLLLGSTGGVLAATIAIGLTRLVVSLQSQLPLPIPLMLDLSFDWRVALFATLLSLATAMVFGLAPAFQSTRIDINSTLKECTGGANRSRLRALFIVSQLAMSTLLLVTAGVLVHSLSAASQIDRGFRSEGVLTASMNLTTRNYTPERGMLFYDDLVRRLDQQPGIASVGLTNIVPLTLSSDQSRVSADDTNVSPRLVLQTWVSPGYFKTMTIPFIGGRDFDASDRAGLSTTIVTESLAREFWRGQSAIGKHLRIGDAAPIEIVGIVRDSNYTGVGETPRPAMYRPITERYIDALTILIRTTGNQNLMSIAPILRAEIRALDPDLAITGIVSLEDATSISLVPVKAAATLAGTLGVLALVLAAIGIYGVMSFIARQRTREIGIRMTLGAQPSSVIQLVTKQGMKWTAMGLVMGLAAAFAVTRSLSGLLYGVSSTDVLAYFGSAAVLATSCYVACYLPARRATRVDPMLALRDE